LVRRGQWRTVLLCLGLLVGGTTVVLGLIEGGFRLHQRLYPSTARGFFWVPKPEYGWGLAPGREGPFNDDHGEFRTHVRINSLGLHDVEQRYAKSPGVFRILILGDSYIEALQVDLEQGSGRLLQGLLTTRSGRPVEVISAGVASWGTDNELLYFRHEGHKYQPDLVLLFFTTSNDVRDNYAPFNRMAAQANVNKPVFAVNRDGELEMQPGPRPVHPPPWWRQLHLGEYLYLRLGGKIELPGAQQNSVPPGVPADMWVHALEYRDEVKEAWRVTEALILAVRDEAVAHRARFAVVVHGGPWVYHEDRWKFMLMQDSVAAKTWDRRKPERLVTDFLLRERIVFLNTFDAFEAAKGRDQLFFRFDPHWTTAGHRVVAQTVADFLLAQGLAPPGVSQRSQW
jgi:hypothetical protein